MSPSSPYILISIAALVILAILAYATFRSGRPTRITLLAGLAFAFVLAGILLGEDTFVSYGLIGLGILLAIIDIIQKSRGPVG